MNRVLVVAFLTLAGGTASAQQIFSEVQRAAMAQQNAEVRVNVGFNIFVPVAGGLGEESMAAHERARRQMYQLATKECSVLIETIAANCRIEGLNVNVNRHHGQQQPEGFSVNANMNFRVTLK